LLGKKVSDDVEIHVHAEPIIYKITEIS